MKNLKNVVLTFAFFVGVLAPIYAQTAEEILQKHEMAMGGSDKWKSLKTLIIKNKLSVQGNEIKSTNYYLVGQAFKSETELMGNKMINAYDGKNAWMIRPTMMGGTGKPEDAPAEMADALGADLRPGSELINAKSNGSTIELDSKEKVDGEDAYVFTVTNKSGKVLTVYVSASSHFIIKITGKQTVNGQEVETQQILSNYKPVEGLFFPFTTEASGPMGSGVLTLEVTSIEVNPTIDAAIFKKPEN